MSEEAGTDSRPGAWRDEFNDTPSGRSSHDAMNAIVRLALARPYTFIIIIIMAILIVIAGVLSAIRTPKDVFPDIGIPVVAVAWAYTNPSPQNMSGRIQLPFQRALTTTVNDIEHIESQALTGAAHTISAGLFRSRA